HRAAHAPSSERKPEGAEREARRRPVEPRSEVARQKALDGASAEADLAARPRLAARDREGQVRDQAARHSGELSGQQLLREGAEVVQAYLGARLHPGLAEVDERAADERGGIGKGEIGAREIELSPAAQIDARVGAQR